MFGQSQWGKGEWGKAVVWQPETGLFGEPIIRETPQLPREISHGKVKQIKEQPKIEQNTKR